METMAILRDAAKWPHPQDEVSVRGKPTNCKLQAVMPAKAGIQYPVTAELNGNGAEYWIIRFRG